MNDYLLGKKLFGDDFSIEDITQWYNQESEGYADLGSNNNLQYSYGYNNLNQMYGFNKIDKLKTFENVLGFGAAYGHELEPIISKVSAITIVEPSDQLKSKKIGTLTPTYVKPNLSGTLLFNSNSFDLITCFGTLHHIPNVSHVLTEMIRVLKPGGILLLREPINSMGDWNYRREGLTKNERGIPASFFKSFFKNQSVSVVSTNYCFTMTALFQRKFGHYLKRPIYSYKSYLLFDKLLSTIFAPNITYHAKNKIDRIAPSSVFYTIKKNS